MGHDEYTFGGFLRMQALELPDEDEGSTYTENDGCQNDGKDKAYGNEAYQET